MWNLDIKETEISQKRSKGIKNWKITYSVILSVLSNTTNLILGFSSPLKFTPCIRILYPRVKALYFDWLVEKQEVTRQNNMADPVNLQYQVKQNSEELQDFLKDLYKWEKDVHGKDQLLGNSKSVSNSVRNLDMREFSFKIHTCIYI